MRYAYRGRSGNSLRSMQEFFVFVFFMNAPLLSLVRRTRESRYSINQWASLRKNLRHHSDVRRTSAPNTGCGRARGPTSSTTIPKAKTSASRVIVPALSRISGAVHAVIYPFFCAEVHFVNNRRKFEIGQTSVVVVTDENSRLAKGYW